MSPATHLYLDQKYNKHTRLGLSWAGQVSVKDSHRWDPGRYLRAAVTRRRSSGSTHNWGRFAGRLGRQAPRWRAMGIYFYRAPAIPWS
jgi:hexosaminidase